jgi:hypothetical protein
MLDVSAVEVKRALSDQDAAETAWPMRWQAPGGTLSPPK